MQFTKDSFYMALLIRLISLNPQRTVTLNGTLRPALIVAENELVVPVEPLPDAFYIEWGAVQPVQRQEGGRPLLEMECVISHHTFGTVPSGVDRGRTLAQLDAELLSICQPQRTPKRDYTQLPARTLAQIFYGRCQRWERYRAAKPQEMKACQEVAKECVWSAPRASKYFSFQR